MKKTKTELLKLCATYLIQMEYDDFVEYIRQGDDPENHIYSTSYKALYGVKTYKEHLRDIKNTI